VFALPLLSALDVQRVLGSPFGVQNEFLKIFKKLQRITRSGYLKKIKFQELLDLGISKTS